MPSLAAQDSYEVVVGNLGRVHEGPTAGKAKQVYLEYKGRSQRSEHGDRVANELVTLFKNGEIVLEHVPDDNVSRTVTKILREVERVDKKAQQWASKEIREQLARAVVASWLNQQDENTEPEALIRTMRSALNHVITRFNRV